MIPKVLHHYRQRRRGLSRLGVAIGMAAVAGSAATALALMPSRTGAASVPGVWLQTMDSCKQAIGGASYQIIDANKLVNTVVKTASASPTSVNGTCPAQQGNCSSMSAGCVEFVNLPYADTYQIHQTVTPPPNPSNPQGYAPCNGGSACRSETVNMTIDSTGKVSAVSTVIQPNGATQYYPSTGSYSGTASNPIVFHDYGLGTGSCDGDTDADDHLTGGTPATCAYSPESGEATACQPYPWSCTLGLVSSTPTPSPTPVPTPSPTPLAKATSFSLSTPTAPVAGGAFSETITALTSSATTATGYTGSKSLSWVGASASPSGATPHFPTNPVSFSSGVAKVTVTLFDAQTTSLGVGDGTINGKSGSFTVAPAAASQLALAAPTSATAGSPFSVGVTAFDAYRNIATSYAGGRTLSWSGPSAAPSGTSPSYPANPVTFNAGSATVSVTLYDAQTTSLSVTDGSISAHGGNITVAPGAIAALLVSLPSTSTFNQAVTATVTSVDAWHNVETSDGSTLAVSTSDLLATAPSSATLNAGTVSFSVTFRTPGQQSITVSEGGTSGSASTSVQL